MSPDGRAGGVSRKGFLFPKKEEREGGRGKKEARRKEGREEGPVFCWTLIFGCGTRTTLLPRKKQG